MIICHSRRFIFVHSHKCGGESVEMACSPSLRFSDVLIGNRHRRWIRGQRFLRKLLPMRDKGQSIENFVIGWRTGLNKHSSAAEIRDRLGDEAFAGYYRFALVRRPEDRSYSLFKWAIGIARRQLASAPEFAAVVGHGMTWEESVDAFWRVAGHPPSAAATFFADDATQQRHPVLFEDGMVYLPVRTALRSPDFNTFIRAFEEARDPDEGYRSQTAMLTDPATGALLVDELVRLEEVDGAWPAIADRIGAPRVLPKQNRSSGAGIEPMSARAREFARRIYADDVALLGY